MTTEQSPSSGARPLPSSASLVDEKPSSVGSIRRLTGRQVGGLVLVSAVAMGVILVLAHLGASKAAKPSLPAPAATATNGRPFENNVPPANNTPHPAKAAFAMPLPAPHRAPLQDSFFHSARESPAMEALNAPIMGFNQAGASTSSNASAQGARHPAPSSATPSALSARLASDRFAPAKAHRIAHPDFTIAAGTIIPCTLQTAIDSTLPGFVKCVLPEPVRSMTGRVTLLDKGTQVLGEIKAGLQQGQDRLFILWTRAITPENLAIRLASPGADALGRAGIAGAVDNHFWKRFGAAIMLSVIGGSFQVAANAAQNGAGNAYFTSLNSNTGQVANTALENTIAIPPTLRRNQGANVSIFVARDLNFANVYKLSLAGQ